MMTISLVNSYGVPLVTPHMITVDLATEAVGSIVKDGFYHNGDCTNNINDSSPLVMNTGTFGQNFYFKPSEVNNNFKIYYQSGSYVAYDCSDSFQSFSVSNFTSSNYINLNIPRFNGKRIVGDHEFTAGYLYE